MHVNAIKLLVITLSSTAVLCACGGEPVPTSNRTTSEIIAASSDSDWRSLDPQNTLYMDVDGQRIVIELAEQFAPEHTGNIKQLARQGYWDGLSIYRSQDNFVVQFGDPSEGEARRALGAAEEKLPAEFSTRNADIEFTRLPDADGWAPQVGFSKGFASGHDPKSNEYWLAHCYGVLGAGRDMAADSSNGTELYVVTGQSPRQLDLNITTVGRVVEGMEWLSTIKRGPAPMGFYADESLRTPIVSIKLGSDLPVAEHSSLQIMRTDTAIFAEFVESRRNRKDQWYVRPAGHIDLCNIQVPTRSAPATGLN